MSIKGWNPGMFVANATGDPTIVSETTPFAKGQLGTVAPISNTILFDPGYAPRIYQYILRDSTDGLTLATAGSPAHWLAAGYLLFSVTSDVSESSDAGGYACAGVFAGIYPLAGKYGFIQVGGVGPALFKATETETCASGVPITPTATDLEFDTIATAQLTAKPPLVGYCLGAKDAGSIGTNVTQAILFPPRLGW